MRRFYVRWALPGVLALVLMLAPEAAMAGKPPPSNVDLYVTMTSWSVGSSTPWTHCSLGVPVVVQNNGSVDAQADVTAYYKVGGTKYLLGVPVATGSTPPWAWQTAYRITVPGGGAVTTTFKTVNNGTTDQPSYNIPCPTTGVITLEATPVGVSDDNPRDNTWNYRLPVSP